MIWFEEDEEDDFAELDDATELLLFTEELLATEEELFSLEELTTDEEDSTELEDVTELELTTELLDCFASLAMTLEEELPGSSVGDEAVKIEEDDTSTGFSSPDEPFAEVLSSQATRPKASANAQVPRARKFFFMSKLNPAFSRIIL